MKNDGTRKVKVAHIFNEINFSGAEVMYAQAAPLFQDHGFELFAISTGKSSGNYTQEIEKAGYKIYHKPITDLKFNTLPLFFFYFAKFYFFLKKQNINIIHIHRSSHYWFFALCARLAGLRAIRTVHSVFKNRRFTWLKAYLERLTARRLLKVTFHSISESVYKNELSYYRNPTIKINNWFDSGRFFPAFNSYEKLHSRNQLAITDTDFVIISTGSCSEIKNHHDIIYALAIVNRHFPCTYLHLGTGILEQDEKNLAQALGIQNRIIFAGNVNAVRHYLIAADIFVMTSKLEGLANAAIEAMACKLPSILYNVPGLKDLINESNNGLLIPPNPEALADAIIFLHGDLSSREKMGENAYIFTNSSFSLCAGVEQITHLYRTPKTLLQKL